MDLGVFYEVIVPLMKVAGTATICISTPLGSWNFYSELTDVKDARGRHVFNVIKVGMACDACAGTEREAECTHPSTNVPEWNTDAGVNKVKSIMGERKTLLQREIMGVVADAEHAAFNERDLKALFTRAPRAEPHPPVDTLYVAVDPNGGSQSTTGSETAIVTIHYDGDNIVLCGADNHATADGVETRELVRAHLRALRASACFASARIVLLAEANLGNEAQEIANEFVGWRGVEIPTCGTREYGVWTTHAVKSAYVFRLAEKLAARAVSYHEPFVSANPFTGGGDARAARRELERQMRSFQRIVLLSRALHGTTRVAHTGKADKDHQQSSRKRDDLCLALLMAVYWSGQHRAGALATPVRTYGSRLLTSAAAAPRRPRDEDDLDEEDERGGGAHKRART